MSVALCFTFFQACPCTAEDRTVIYVNISADSAIRDGTSWTTAFTGLDVALAKTDAQTSSNLPCEIWVAKGEYRPTSGTDRAKSFNLKSGVALYGGFAGTEDIRESRDISANKTILTGNIGDRTISADNSYHVVYCDRVDSTTILDGFTVTEGNTSTHGSNSLGGGMYNYDSALTVTNCAFCENNAAGSGGGMCNYGGTPTVTNCAFIENSAADSGGGMYNLNITRNLIVTNCTFSGNSAGQLGGGMYNRDNSSPTVKNCIFWGNAGEGEIRNFNGATLTLNNCVIEGGDVDEETSFDIIISDDPCLISLDYYGGPTKTFALGHNSSAIDAGKYCGQMPSYDQRGVVRPQGISGDIGAYEAVLFKLTMGTAGEGKGTPSPEHGNHVYPQYSTARFSANADISSNFVGWSGDISGTANPFIVTMSKDMSVIAEFSLKAFTIQASASIGGSVSPAGDNRVLWGAYFPVTISANPGYAILDVSVDNQSVGARGSYIFENVKSNHRLEASVKKASTPSPAPGPDPTPGPEPTPGTGPSPAPKPLKEDLPSIPDASDALDDLIDGTVSLDLPEGITGLSFDSFSSNDIDLSSRIKIIKFSDISEDVLSKDMEKFFLTGISFNLSSKRSPDLGKTGILPLDVTLDISRDKLSLASPKIDTLLHEINILKITGSEIYNLVDIVKKIGIPLEDFFSITEDKQGDFQIKLGLLVADASVGDKPPVQPVATSGDCRFLIFDGETDDRFLDPIIALQILNTDNTDDSGKGGCSTVYFLPSMALFLVPMILLGKRR